MPPKNYPKLRSVDGSVKGRIRKGYVPVEQLKAAVDGTESLEERTVIKVLYFCALRASEVGLQPASHFDAKRGTLDILRLKGSNGHTYPLEPWVLNDLREWLKVRPAKSPYLFPHPDEHLAPLDRHNVLRYWKRAAQRAGLAKALWHPHVLKHSVATHMLERGDDVMFVKDWLGHARMDSTLIYVEVVGKRLAIGQAVMKGLVGELE
jgi:site-specific recombinase XerD